MRLNWCGDVHQSATWGRSILTPFRWTIWSALEPIFSPSFQTHVVREILRKRFYFPSALVVCVSHPCFENRLACDCLCHFVKFGVIVGDLKSCWREKLRLWWRHSIFADVSVSGPRRHPLKFAQLLPSLLFSLHMFICLSLLTLNIKKTALLMRSAQGTDESHHLPEMTIVVVFVQTM